MKLRSLNFALLLAVSLLGILVEAGTLDICGFKYGAIHHGEVNMGNAYIAQKLEGIRSKLECATYCHANLACRTAVYQQDSDCILIKNFTDTLTMTETPHTSNSDEIIELRSFTDKAGVGLDGIQQAPDCPSECTGYSVCILDCTYLDQDGEAEPVCMDISTSQYTSDGCGFPPHIQSKEYYLANLDRDTSSNGYTFFTITFVKMYDWTTLQVRWRGTLRGGYGWGGGWGRYRILFNGGHCGNPGWIESMHYNSDSDSDHYKPTGINGICYGLAAQSWSITLNVEIGASSYFRVGYATWASRMYVDEIGQGTWTAEPAQKACPSLSDFNYREHISTSTWNNEPTVTLWNFGYTKMEADTILRINTDIVYRQHSQGSNTATCATWYILIDGNHCSPYAHGKTVANLGDAHLVNNEHRSAESEGHCVGVTAGYHTLSLYLATCNWGTSYLDVETGWNSARQRIIINEMRRATNIAAVMAADGNTVYRLPMLNIVIHGGEHIANGNDNGAVWNLPDYNKIYGSTGLRLAVSSDARNLYNNAASYDPCCRHYMVINGVECSTPGTIEGINYLNKATNLHRMVMIEGICDEIPAGTVTISVYAGLCKGYGRAGECYFGWNSYIHMMVSESFVDREIIQF